MAYTHELTNEQRQALTKRLAILRDRTNTAEGLGRAISNYVLSEGASRGTLHGDHLEVPLTVTVSLPQQHEVQLTPAVPNSGSTDELVGIGVSITCVKTCVKVLGVEVFCKEECDTGTLTVGP